MGLRCQFSQHGPHKALRLTGASPCGHKHIPSISGSLQRIGLMDKRRGMHPQPCLGKLQKERFLPIGQLKALDTIRTALINGGRLDVGLLIQKALIIQAVFNGGEQQGRSPEILRLDIVLQF